MADDEYGPTYEEYIVYIDSGGADEIFRAFCSSLGGVIEISWKNTHDV